MIRIGEFHHQSSADDRFVINVTISQISIHPKYNGITAHYDVAVLRTEKIKFSKMVSPICLPSSESFNINEYDERSAELIGWGSKMTTGPNSDFLKRVTITVFPSR